MCFVQETKNARSALIATVTLIVCLDTSRYTPTKALFPPPSKLPVSFPANLKVMQGKVKVTAGHGQVVRRGGCEEAMALRRLAYHIYAVLKQVSLAAQLRDRPTRQHPDKVLNIISQTCHSISFTSRGSHLLPFATQSSVFPASVYAADIAHLSSSTSDTRAVRRYTTGCDRPYARQVCCASGILG
jgi:hypothetical protein